MKRVMSKKWILRCTSCLVTRRLWKMRVRLVLALQTFKMPS